MIRQLTILTLLAFTVSASTAQSLAIMGVTVIDVVEGVAFPGQTVVVSDDRIAAVGDVAAVGVPTGATVIDGRGKFLIPGLSDAGAAGVFWGIGLHQELELMVSAGLTETEALRAATLGPAEFLEATDSLGTVEEGKRADLVLLDSNPLENIANTQRIRAVVLNGRLVDRDALDALLAAAERVAQE